MKSKSLSIERILRRASYRLIAYRDGHAGAFTYKKEFEVLAAATRDAIESHSYEKLKRILGHAYRTSDFYRESWRAIGFNPADMQNATELTRLPILKKAAIQDNKDALASDRLPKNKLETSYTGGSSGNPTSFYRDRACASQRVGRQLAILERCGYRLGDPCGLVWGIHAETPGNAHWFALRQRFRKFASGKEALCCTVMHPEQMKDFHRRLKRFGPRVLYGYPNAMTHFAEFIVSEGLEPIRVDRILCTAERLSPDQRARLTEIFGGEVFNLYCTREHGCIGFECKEHRGFHVDAGSVHLEVVSNGRAVGRGQSGKIVVTDLLNYGMPFIRYEIGDVGVLSEEPCRCGCHLPVLRELGGRVSDLLIRPDGSTVAGLMLIDMFMDNPKIGAMQIVQEEPTRLDVFLEVGQRFDHNDRMMVKREFRAYLGQDMDVSLNIVAEIPRNPNSGKFQEVICRVPASSGRR